MAADQLTVRHAPNDSLVFVICGSVNSYDHTILHDIEHGRHRWGVILMASVAGTYLAMLFWLGGFKYADASVASVLNETFNVMIVLLAWLFLGEALSRRKITGAILTFCGVVIFIGG